MKAIMVMFDTLSKKFLPNYGNDWVNAPNFDRLREKCATFDNFYGGSMPCMPARRELHTGKYNFLHRSWGPLEPFDHSVFEDLDKQGIYTHLITDHSHYFEDGGATYHNRYSSWESFRGQEGDRWIPRLEAPEDTNQHPLNKQGLSRLQHMANRTKMTCENEMSSVKVIDRGLDFLIKNHEKDNWFLQMECFDPHEPFYVPEKYRALYDCTDDENHLFWPVYTQLDDNEAAKKDVQTLQKEYAALISMCDHHLGRVLDFMDRQNMWEDTLLIVNTDHGFLLGEHAWLGKNNAPMYEEIVHIPYFMHVPQSNWNGERIQGLAQTIDIPATIRDYFGLEEKDSDGRSLLKGLGQSNQGHESVLFGINGGYVNIYDGKYTYMKASAYSDNAPLVNYTLMPTNMRGFFATEELQQAELIQGGRFTENMQVLKIHKQNQIDSFSKGDLLFDIASDPEQNNCLSDPSIKAEMAEKLRERLTELEAPLEEMMRLGLIDREG
ncbi:sulfatase [Enterococcus hulanensis]|uniref:sulfatase n=1 Tax=Enterococcus hulanensis TaxID=2559929 RepID=UPI00288F8901|nr:sulfatase [Enterococcus hulanensis]MDT2662468.1 sulfatase [Enterococcus hulanensis]